MNILVSDEMGPIIYYILLGGKYRQINIINHLYTGRHMTERGSCFIYLAIHQ